MLMLNIDDYLDGATPYYAHLKGAHKETLKEHSDLTYDYYKKIVGRDVLKSLLTDYFKAYGMGTEALIAAAIERFEAAVYLHDIGKINRNFQIVKMKNTHLGTEATENTNHSVYSALIYLDVFQSIDALTRKEQRQLNKLTVIFAYTMARHHGYLNNLETFEAAIEAALDAVCETPALIGGYLGVEALTASGETLLNRVRKGVKPEADAAKNDAALILYSLTKYLYALIVASDFYATGTYMSGQATASFGTIDDVEAFTRRFKADPLIRRIHAYTESDKTLEPINHLRSQMFLEASKTFLDNRDAQVFYLEAPTGSGKTLTSIQLAVNAVTYCPEIRRIYYVFPFNTLVDQTYKTLQGLFDPKDLAVINSLEAIKKEEHVDSDAAYLDRLMRHYPVILTSHVNFFKSLVGASREAHLAFAHLAGSVVIIDEIQSYKNMIWHELILLMHTLAERFHIKFIIMSATLPKMTTLTGRNSVSLIQKSDKYFKHPLFLKRTVPDYRLLEGGKVTLEALADTLCTCIAEGKERILVEFIDKVSARQFYNCLLETCPDKSYDIVELTGDDNVLYRETLIGKLKERSSSGVFLYRKVVVVATQVIEAGVDIDMSIGFKDISLIDSEEQFAGRINRSCLKETAPIYFFDYYDARHIYRGDVRVNFSLRDEVARRFFTEKDYPAYFEAVLKRLDEEKHRFTEHHIDYFYTALHEMAFLTLQKRLRLIDDESITVFIPQRFETDDGVLDGEAIWRRYTALLENRELPYTEKQLALSRLNKPFSYFTYRVRTVPTSFQAQLGDDLYLLKPYAYIEDGKFNRQLYNEEAKGRLSAEQLIL